MEVSPSCVFVTTVSTWAFSCQNWASAPFTVTVSAVPVPPEPKGRELYVQVKPPDPSTDHRSSTTSGRTLREKRLAPAGRIVSAYSGREFVTSITLSAIFSRAP